MTEINELLASTKPRTVQQTIAGGALKPVMQSAVGVLRETASLLDHIAAFGIALVWEPKMSRPKGGVAQARLAGPNVIPFSPRLRKSRVRNETE